MKSINRIAVGCALLLMVSGCNEQEMIKRFTPPAQDRIARDFIEMVRESRTNDALADLDFHALSANARGGILQLSAMLQGGRVKNIEEIGAFTNSLQIDGKSTSQTKLTYQLELSSGWFVMAVVFDNSDRKPAIYGAHLDPIPESLEVINRFTFFGKHFVHYLFFAGVIVLPILCLIALVKCIRTKIRRKWLWILFVIFGFVTISLNWTTGAIGIQPLSFLLLGASALKGGSCAPWIMGISLPIGAVVFLIKRKSLITNSKATPPAIAH